MNNFQVVYAHRALFVMIRKAMFPADLVIAAYEGSPMEQCHYRQFIKEKANLTNSEMEDFHDWINFCATENEGVGL